MNIETKRKLRTMAGAPNNTRVKVVPGADPPRYLGESSHYETRGGTRINHPSAYSKRGWSNMIYCSSTLRVEVGRDWLTANGF